MFHRATGDASGTARAGCIQPAGIRICKTRRPRPELLPVATLKPRVPDETWATLTLTATLTAAQIAADRSVAVNVAVNVNDPSPSFCYAP